MPTQTWFYFTALDLVTLSVLNPSLSLFRGPYIPIHHTTLIKGYTVSLVWLWPLPQCHQSPSPWPLLSLESDPDHWPIGCKRHHCYDREKRLKRTQCCKIQDVYATWSSNIAMWGLMNRSLLVELVLYYSSGKHPVGHVPAAVVWYRAPHNHIIVHILVAQVTMSQSTIHGRKDMQEPWSCYHWDINIMVVVIK